MLVLSRCGKFFRCRKQDGHVGVINTVRVSAFCISSKLPILFYVFSNGYKNSEYCISTYVWTKQKFELFWQKVWFISLHISSDAVASSNGINLCSKIPIYPILPRILPPPTPEKKSCQIWGTLDDLSCPEYPPPPENEKLSDLIPPKGGSGSSYVETNFCILRGYRLVVTFLRQTVLFPYCDISTRVVSKQIKVSQIERHFHV